MPYRVIHLVTDHARLFATIGEERSPINVQRAGSRATREAERQAREQRTIPGFHSRPGRAGSWHGPPRVRGHPGPLRGAPTFCDSDGGRGGGAASARQGVYVGDCVVT
jgi:hypothetical protein